jgi:RecB family exonuclease
LKTALAVRPLELEPPDADHWLKPTDRGTALHETFAAYYRELRAAGSRPAPSDFERLVQLLELELARLRQVLPPPSPSVEAREIAQLHRDLAHFLKLEVAASPAVVACEVGFGMADTLGEPLARLEPVMIDLGADLRFPLQGRIDRIDRVEGGYEVIDYKTGYQLTAEANPRYAGGQLLQHALYALVAEALLDGPIQASSYYFPAHHAKKDRVSFSYPDKAELAEVLRLVMEPLRTGAFAHTVQSEKHCGYCDFRPACVAQSDQGMLAKYELAENAPLHCRAHLRRVR